MATLAFNRRARHDYEFLETYQAGLVLTGAEVKSIKAGRAQLQGAYVAPKGNELWLIGMNVAGYPPAASSQQPFDSLRDRKLLLKRTELDYVLGRLGQGGLTLVPVSVYTSHRLVKVEVALARGKKAHDKRVSIRKRELEREVRRTLRTRKR